MHFAIVGEDVIIRDEKGKIYPIKKKAFEKSYEVIEDEYAPDIEAEKKIVRPKNEPEWKPNHSQIMTIEESLNKERVSNEKQSETKNAHITYSWQDGSIYGGVVLYCKCGAVTDVDVVDSYDEFAECEKCGRKYRIYTKTFVEEVKQDEE